jgi:hypothetical protein
VGKTVEINHFYGRLDQKEANMACTIADNPPLKRLQTELGLSPQCHSFREHCIQGYEPRITDYALGAPGAVLGYCQALFSYTGDPASHTEKVRHKLIEIEAPWANSHELFWGYRRQEVADEFIAQSISPLIGTGRVPILITSLDPAKDRTEIESIVATSPPMQDGDTVLLRVVLTCEESVRQIATIMQDILAQSRINKRMPKWWPLLQGSLSIEQWRLLQMLLGEDREYVNVAVNPFTPIEVFECMLEQITVGQIAIGLANGIAPDGTIRLAPGMKIFGAAECAEYSLLEYMNTLGSLDDSPTLIVLGPSMPNWTDGENQKRLETLLPILKNGCETFWGRQRSSRWKSIWNMKA